MSKTMVRMTVLFFLLIFTSVISAESPGTTLPPEARQLLPPKSKIISVASGDVNGDGVNEYIVVLQRRLSYREMQSEVARDRELIIITGTGPGCAIAARTKRAVLCSDCGGPAGDPIGMIVTGRNYFSIDHSGGSQRKWYNRAFFYFSRATSRWQLTGFYCETKESRGKKKPPAVRRIKMLPKDFGVINLEDFDLDHFMNTERLEARPEE